ncbi:hypothetical protein MN205_11005 [Kineococcus sp. TRM81007]|uniref:hypothetical protein n=1 Tax=Kineococcus sp. TRM81007 TaxID=2925831 RepID=UPI001F5A1812|nr:hypothetical protein [Kineococcus sp. TRM81007]MCI2239015.1 hypothetical protein [Kineococcus sp. TRM81007]
MRNTFRRRAAAVVVGAGVVLGGFVTTAAPANALSPAATAFNNCLTRYTEAANKAERLRQSSLAQAVHLTGLANCNYQLSQRSDISDQQEINAINNYNRYRPAAQQAITKAGLVYYRSFIAKAGLAGLRL